MTSHKIHKNTPNTVKFARNLILTDTCQYNISKTHLGYWDCLVAINLQIYLETSSPQQANNVPKLPGVNYVAKNWALVMILKALPLAHFSNALSLK